VRILEAYRSPGRGDLGECLERVLKAGGTSAGPGVNLEEVDLFLQQLAGQCAFSDPSVPRSSATGDDGLADLLWRLQPVEAKWFVRIMLKDLTTISVDEDAIFQGFHFLLRYLLKFQRNFGAAVDLLKTEFREYPVCPDPESARLFRQGASEKLAPVVGIKIGRPNFIKARGIDHCLKMLGSKKWIAERKYDGEYCEVHIDLENGNPATPTSCIKIFSKSGKDSTADRIGLHQTLIDCLDIGKPDCKFRRRAIILGEMMVYSDTRHCILPFERIRNHVTRSGRYIGNQTDSPPENGDHLAIVLFDILLLDDEIIMKKPVDERRKRLREVCRAIPGRSMRAEWTLIDFNETDKAKRRLIGQFAMSITQRHEGLVLKPCDGPYIPLSTHYQNSYIKLKKDLMGMGDEADFAVIGASYNAQLAASSPVQNLTYTTFHLGCLVNKSDVRRFEARPKYQRMGTIDCGGQCIPREVLEASNTLGRCFASPFNPDDPHRSFDLTASSASPVMDVAFSTPLIFEVVGSKFAKASGSNFYMLIFPRVIKLHQDRTVMDCPSFQELQEQAGGSITIPDAESQETRDWVAKLERRCIRKVKRLESCSLTSPTGKTPERRLHRSPTIHLNIPPAIQNVALGLITPRASSPVITMSSPCLSPSTIENVQYSTTSKKRKRTTPTKRNHLTTIHPSPTSVLTSISPNILSHPPQSPKHTSLSSLCNANTCLLFSTTVHLAPCIQQTPYITQTLLPTHSDLHLTPSLTHWSRASFAHVPLTSTVSESQSHPGLRKMVLVERHRSTQVQSIVRELENLEEGKFRERVEVWDWRLLEICRGHDEGERGKEVMACFLGALIRDGTGEGRSRFIWQHGLEGQSGR
jgi:DNA ligase-4